MEARLVLQDGTLFKGSSRGAAGEAWGEVVFDTSMTGYQEILTDPSYCGHILTMTFPLIGNYGINGDDFESRRPFLRGLIAREFCRTPSNWRSIMTLEAYLKENGIIAMDDLDTRALTKHLRENGSMPGVITTADTPRAELLARLKNSPAGGAPDLAPEVTTPEMYTWENDGAHLVILDLGLKLSLGRLLHNTGCRVTVAPASFTAGDIMQLAPAGVVLSNGPGDPRRAEAAIQVARELAGKAPLLGIGLGHQVIALAQGAQTSKLKFGHRGANHPVKDLRTGRVFITTQNHGFVVEADSLPAGLQITQQNLNDGTIEGLREDNLKIITVQYHPAEFSSQANEHGMLALFLDYTKTG